MKIALAVLVLVLSIFAAACGSDDDDEDAATGAAGETASEIDGTGQTITIGAWGGDYNDWTREAFVDPFSQETGAEFKYDNAPSEMVAKVRAQNAAGDVTWDVIDSAFGLDAWTLWNDELLEPVPEDLAEKWTEELGEDLVTPFGYSLGNLGDVIVCNRETVDNCPSNPEEFFDTEAFPGDRAMYGAGPLIALMLAAQADGVPRDELFPMDIDAAFAKMEEIEDSVRLWYDSPDALDQAILNEEVDMAIAFNGRVANLVKEGVPLDVSWEGAVYEPVYMVVVKDAPSKDLAWAYLDFIAMSPEVQATYVELTGYGVPNQSAFESVPERIAEFNPDYPPNFEQMAIQDLDWFLENQDEIESRWRDFVSG